jgi:hypothetical protein
MSYYQELITCSRVIIYVSVIPDFNALEKDFVGAFTKTGIKKQCERIDL